MKIRNYQAIVEEFGAAAGIDDVSTLLRGQALAYGPCHVHLIHDADADQCRIVLDLGPVSLGERATARGLVVGSENLSAVDLSFELRIEPQLERVLWEVRVPLQGLRDGTSLAAVFEDWIDPAIDAWQALWASRDGDRPSNVALQIGQPQARQHGLVV